MADVLTNLFQELPDPASGEVFTDLLRRRNLTIERIVSSGSPDTGLQCQGHDEWVILLEGGAVLEVAGERVRLSPGDHLLIPAGTMHRVLQTRPEPRCIWLAVHLHPAGQQARNLLEPSG
jgi:cupin 2 domain-containing protein